MANSQFELGLVLCALLPLSCAGSHPTTKLGTFIHRAGQVPSLVTDSFLLVLPQVKGLPGDPRVYQMAFSGGMHGSGELMTTLSTPISDWDAPVASGELSRSMFAAAAADRRAVDSTTAALLAGALLATRRSAPRFSPRFVVVARIDGREQTDEFIVYRVTAAIYDLHTEQVFAATRFDRRTRPAALLQEVLNIGAQLISAMSRAT